MLEIRELGSTEALEAIRPLWNPLLKRSETDCVFLTYEHCTVWWETFGGGRERLVLLAYDDDTLVGIAPLAISTKRRMGRNRRRIEFIGSGQADYLDFIIDGAREDVLEALCEHLLSIRDRWDEILLNQIPAASGTVHILGSLLGERGVPHDVQAGDPCYVVALRDRAQIQRDINRQSTLKKLTNRLRRRGQLEYRYREAQGLGPLDLNGFFQQHIGRWERTLTPSVFNREVSRQYYLGLLAGMAPQGWFSFSALMLDDMAIAYLVGFEYGGRVLLQRSSFDPYYSKYSPGRLIVRFLLQHSLDQGLEEVDLLAGNEEYKAYLVNEVRETRRIVIYRSLIRWRWSGLARQAQRPMERLSGGEGGWLWRLRMSIRRARRRHGTKGLLLRGMRGVLDPLIRVVSMELFVWAGGDLGDAYCSLPLEIRRGSASDLDRLCSFLGARTGGRQVGLVEQRLSLGDMPYLAFSHGNLAHVAWVCRRPEVEVTEVWGSLALGPDAAYAMDCRTSLLFRGQGIYPAVLQHIVQDMATEGATRVVVACESGNRASWKGIEKAGFVRVRRVLAIKLLGLRLGSGRISTEALAGGP